MTRFVKRWKYTISACVLLIAANVICVAMWDDWWIPLGTVLVIGYMIWEFRRGVR